MDKHRAFWGIVAIAGMWVPTIIGLVVGAIRYKKHGEEIRKELKAQYDKAQEKDGISTLLYKNWRKRVFQKTFGVPMMIGFLTGLVVMIFAFSQI